MDTPTAREALVIGCGTMAIITCVMLAWGVDVLTRAIIVALALLVVALSILLRAMMKWWGQDIWRMKEAGLE